VVINAYWHFIVMQTHTLAVLLLASWVINAYWHFIVMQGST
jgi:hypothetical protein